MLVAWAGQLGDQRLWAVQDCRHLSRRLERDLLCAGQRIVRVPTKMMAGARRTSRDYGKSDPIEALAVARAALQEPDLPVACLDGPARDVRLLVDHRENLVAQRTRIINRLRWHLHELDPTWDPPARSFDRAKTVAQITANLAGRPGTVARLAGRLLQRCVCLTEEIQALDVEIGEQVEKIAPALLDICGCGPLTAAKIIARDRRCPPVPFQGRLRPLQRHGSAAGVVIQPSPPPAQPSRQPPAQLRYPSNRPYASPLACRRPRLSTASQRRRGHHQRGHPSPQTTAVRCDLPSTPKRRCPHRSKPDTHSRLT
jgi:transposase